MLPKIQMNKTVPKAWKRKVINPNHQYKSVKLDERQYMEKEVKKPKKKIIWEKRYSDLIERLKETNTEKIKMF